MDRREGEKPSRQRRLFRVRLAGKPRVAQPPQRDRPGPQGPTGVRVPPSGGSPFFPKKGDGKKGQRGGFRSSPSLESPLLKTTNRGASAPLLETPPGAVLPRRCAPRQARRTARRPPDRAGRRPCSTCGGRNGRGCSSHKAERRKTPSAFCLRPVPGSP